jgi:hypothetical protein
MAFARTFTLGCTAILLSGTAALAQEACTTYTVSAGDNLRFIARAAYGDADLYRVIYEANVQTIGEKADLIEIGTKLVLPCNPDDPTAAAAEAQVEPQAEPAPVAEADAPAANADAEAVVTPVAATPEPAPKLIGLVTGSVSSAKGA